MHLNTLEYFHLQLKKLILIIISRADHFPDGNVRFIERDRNKIIPSI